MLKRIFPLLFTFIFSMNLFAVNHDIHREISDIKLQLQEIKLLDARDERENKLEKLEKDIKKLEEKFNQNNIDKEKLDGKIGAQNKLISEIASNTNRVSWLISMFGVLITVIIIFFALKFGKDIDQEIQNIKIEAEKKLKNWVDKKAESEFKPLIDNAKDEIKKETLDRFDLFVKSLQKNNDKDKKYSYAILFRLAIVSYEENNIEEAISNLEEAITLAETDKEYSQALFTKALILGQLGKYEEEIKVYDELIERFKNSKESNIIEHVANALVNKGSSLVQLGKLEEEIKTYDELIERFKDSKENNILEHVVRALYNKGVNFEESGKLEKAIEVYDELIERFEDSKENNILNQVAKAFLNKGVIFVKLGKLEKAIAINDELIERFEDSKENHILESVAKALLNKGVSLGQLGKLEQEIEIYDELIERFEDSKENSILEKVTIALYNKAIRFGQLGKLKESVETYNELIERFKNSKENKIIKMLISSLLNKIETNIVLSNKNSVEDLSLYSNLIKDNKELLSEFEMLQIFEKAKDFNQNEEIKQWQIKFKDIKLKERSFDELRTWAETLDDEAKRRVLKYDTNRRLEITINRRR